ncbi:hypothetical protein LMG24235_07210 [Paraburkholderia sabiae]|nr:hypothetical protein LMG24235_07210 [Paraburkholderia sabiae]
MNATGTITMTMREVDRFKVIQAVTEARLKPGQAAARLGLGVRQVERLVLRYQAAGVAGLVSGKRGRPGNHQLPPGNHQLPPGKAQRALALIRERYPDFGPTLACEKLRECHGIELAVETVRTLMRAAGLWIPRRERPPKVYQPRNRRACLGELVQIDGSDHRWFEDRAPACTLLVFIDDATGRYFEALAKYLDAQVFTTPPPRTGGRGHHRPATSGSQFPMVSMRQRSGDLNRGRLAGTMGRTQQREALPVTDR